jgi:hypothetical protein
MSLPRQAPTRAARPAGPAACATTVKSGSRKAEYKLLDEIGFDVVDARFAQILDHVKREYKEDRYPEQHAERLTAAEFHVSLFNMTLWMRRKRTVAFLAESEPEEILDLVASGMTPADMALRFDVHPRVVEEYLRVHTRAEDLANAKDAMADMKFARIRQEIMDAKSEIDMKRAVAVHAIDRHVASAHARRYSEDKNIRINAGAGNALQISFVRSRDPEPESPP